MKTVTIAGLGLIGGSLGQALRRRGWRVAFFDPFVGENEARDADAADEKLDAVEGKLIVLATPVGVALTHLAALKDRGALITSACSVMRPLRDAAGDAAFVAGHPFAGSERAGLAAARADLFEGRPWFVERSEPHVDAMIRDAGATSVVIDPAEHDRILALTSHLPQLVSTAMGSLLADVDPMFIGSGARSLLRLAGSSHEVWRPVLEANEANVRSALEKLVKILENVSGSDFEKANGVYRRL